MAKMYGSTMVHEKTIKGTSQGKKTYYVNNEQGKT